MEDDLDRDRDSEQPPLQTQQSDSSTIVVASSGVIASSGQSSSAASTSKSSKSGRGKVKSSSRVREGDDDEVLAQLQMQRTETQRIVGNIGTMLTGTGKVSTNSAWGVWMGTLADKIDERLHEEMVTTTYNIMWDLIKRSKNLPPHQAPVVSQQQPQQQPSQVEDQHVSSYVDMIPALEPFRHRRLQHQTTSTSVPGSEYAFSDWTTPEPTAGQATYLPARPSSNPNLSQSPFANISGVSTLLGMDLNTPTNLVLNSPSDVPPPPPRDNTDQDTAGGFM